MNLSEFSRWMPALGGFVAGLGLLLMLHVGGHLLEPLFMTYFLAWIPALILVAAYRRKGSSAPIPGATLSVAVLLAFMTLYLVSSSVDYPWFYFLKWLPRRNFGPHVVHSQLVQFVLLAAILAPFLVISPKRAGPWFLALFLLSVSMSAYYFMRETGGAPLYHDDHSSLLFRLDEFCRTFPQKVNYNPCWNGGQVSAHPVLSGTAAFGVFFLPFLKFMTVEQCYTPLIAVVFIGVVPLMAVFSMRMAGAGWSAAGCAGILALGTSQFYFLWLLSYGTLGAIFSAACIMPAAACLFRVLFLDKHEKWTGIILVVAGYFLLMWPPNILLGLVLMLAVLVNIGRLSRKKFMFLAVCASAIIILSWSQIMVVAEELLEGSYGGGGRPSPAASAEVTEVLAIGFGKLVDYIRMGHPLLIFLGLGGVVAAVDRIVRRWFFPLLALMALLVGWGPEFMPGFQLSRMIIPLFFTAIIPASMAVENILRVDNARLAFFRAIAIALLITGAFNTADFFKNESRAPYEIMPEENHAMAGWIRSNAPEGTRVLFVGSTIHGYGGGHVAFMQFMSGREMMACDYYHFSPAAVEYDYPPQPWRLNAELFDRFLDLYNVSIITTLRNDWKGYLRSRPGAYREAKSFSDGYLTFFRVSRPALSLFLKGQGRVAADFNRINVELSGTNGPAVIKYNWQPGLAAELPAEIYPYHAGPGVRLIGINPNGQTNIVIRYK